MRRPRWFWATLGVLGIIVLAVAVWAVVTLIHSANNDAVTTLVLDDNTNNDGAENEAVNNYVAQLQKIYDTNSDSSPNSNARAKSVADTVDDALRTNLGSSQENSIRLAEMVVMFQNSDYNKIPELLNRIDLNALSPREQIAYYNIAQIIYERDGNNSKVQEAYEAKNRIFDQLCNAQECKE